MRNLIPFASLVTLVVGAACAAENEQVDVAQMPPVVINTYPPAGDTGVDPSLGEIRVTFSKDMMTEDMWSWVQIDKITFPEVAGDVRYLDDKKTCVLPVKLKPEKNYVVWINSGQHNSFRDVGNRPAVPYLLVFKTGKDSSTASKATTSSREIQKTLDRLLRAIKANDKSLFVVNATDGVKKGMTKQVLAALSKQLGARLNEGYHTRYLCDLNQVGHHIYLWKGTFKDGGDNVVFRLVTKDGKVAGFFLQ